MMNRDSPPAVHNTLKRKGSLSLQGGTSRKISRRYVPMPANEPDLCVRTRCPTPELQDAMDVDEDQYNALIVGAINVFVVH
jgi:hypothetical protein